MSHATLFDEIKKHIQLATARARVLEKSSDGSGVTENFLLKDLENALEALERLKG